MRYFIDSIENEIEKHIQNGKTNLIRLEGIEDPTIYKEVCKYFKNSTKSFEAKLSREKYDDFKSESKSSWKEALHYLDINGFVDKEGAMTKWRNSVASTNEDSTKTILLMGTELVQDKGGLADFFSINIETILRGLGQKKYYSYFEEFIKDSGIEIKDEEESKKVINRVFETIFSIFPIDLIKVSNLVKEIENEDFKVMDDVIESIFYYIPKYWDLPPMNEEKIRPKFSNLRGKNTKIDVIVKANKFLTRQDYKTSYPTDKKISSIKEKLEAYKNNNNIDDTEMFPRDNCIFENFEKFSDALIDFIKGIDYEKNRSEFLKIDFSIINEILKIKVNNENGNKGKKSKVINIVGDPLEVYSEMILTSMLNHKNIKKEYPNEVIIEVENIVLGNCIDDNELVSQYKKISAYLGGLVQFINSEQIEVGEELVSIKYLNNLDPFSDRRLLVISNNEYALEGIEDINISRAKNINVLSKIKFKIKTRTIDRFSYINGDDMTFDDKNTLISSMTSEWQWAFKPVNTWTNQFLLLEDMIKEEDDLSEEVTVPLGWKSSKLKQLISLENEDEFLNKLLEAKIDPILKLHIDKTSGYIRAKLDILSDIFEKMAKEIFEYGFFKAMLNMDSNIYKFINRYDELIKYVSANYETFRSSEKEKAFIVFNLFNIAKDDKEGIESREFEYAIMAPIHPIILEKIVAQKIFLRKSFKDLFESTKDKVVTAKNIKDKITKMVQLSEITSGADSLFGREKLITSEKVISNYAFYYSSDYKSDEIINGCVDNIVEDDEINIGDMLKASPKSLIISENIIDYINIFPTRVDGIKITMLNPENLQYIVAGINDVVKNFADEEINIKLTIVRDIEEKSGVDYLKYWLDNKLSEKENVNIKTFVVNKEFDNSNISKELERVLKQQDIIFISNILTTNKIEVREDIIGRLSKDIDKTKFPMVFPPLPLSKTSTKRAISITQSQFETEYSHTQLVNILSNPNTREGNFKVIKEVEINHNKKDIIRNIHNSAKWVVCMDESIDKEIITDENNGRIVGFTTGKGNYGELNVTVSARNDVLEDIKLKLKKRLKQHFASWKEDERILDEVADFCIEKAQELDGGKILKALNTNDYAIHSFLSYIITLQYLNIPDNNDDYLVRILLNLDSHMHWFEELVINSNDEDKMRPDLLLLEIKKDDFKDSDGKLKISATVIECKMGNDDDSKRKKAIEQVKKGILSLSKIWDKGRSVETSERYWNNQLYRALIFARLNVDEDNSLYEEMLSKIEGVLDGNFKIEWHGKAFAYWINSSGIGRIEEVIEDISEIEHITEDLKLIECGQVEIKKMILPEYERDKKIVFEEVLEEEIDDIENIIEEVNDKNEFIEKDENEVIVFKEKEYVELNKNNLENKSEYEPSKDKINNKIKDEKKDSEKEIFGENEIEYIDVEDKIPSKEENELNKPLEEVRVLIGRSTRGGKEIYWEFGNKGLNNRHLFISGRSGSGKTYCMQCLLYELTRQGIPAIIFDYTDGFREDKLDPIFRESLGDRFKQQLVKFERFGINPFKRQMLSISGFTSPEKNTDIASRIAETFKSVYSLGDQQYSNIYQAARNGLKKYDDKMDFEKLAEELEDLGTKEAKTTLSKIQLFLDSEAFGGEKDFSWDTVINSKGDVFIIQLTGFTRDIQTLLTQLILWDIWNYAKSFGREDNPFVVVLDEAQNLDHGEKSPSGYILTEGRKFGVSGWYATQFLKGQMSADEIGRLQQAAQKIYFAPPENEMKDISKIIDSDNKIAKDWEDKLKVLGKGECVTSGMIKRGSDDSLSRYSPTIIKVDSLEERKNGNSR
ncbi:type IV secretion system DNA-binding domain-containing protein [Clostridium baratii]|uniref:ATP-binding protein n=1 Tax=Clostridium baratii TaxID=1561 RepID=UPI003D33107B